MKTMYRAQKTEWISPIASTLVVISILSGIYYLSYVLNPSNKEDFLLYIVTIIAEMYVVIIAIFTWWTILFHQKPIDLTTYEKAKMLGFDIRELSAALVFSVHKEPLEIVENTISKAVKVRLASQIYVGDDGNRREVREICEKYNVIYITRKTNKFYKSGNLTNVLKYVEEEFVAFFDIDHMPKKIFLEETLPFFCEPKTAFVQTPQYYYNTSNLISKGASGSQNIFYELIMPGKNAFNSSICVGTNVVFRKKALDLSLNGGIYLKDHSEDIYTGMILHEDGWRSVYLPKVLAEGLAPDNLITYFKQQLRWARGGYSILLNRNPLMSKNLDIEQKLQYFFSSIHYLSGFVILFYLLLPVIFLLTGFRPFNSNDGVDWAIHFLPFFVSKFLLIIYLMSAFDVSLISSSIALFPIYIKAFFTEIFNSNYEWEVTNDETKKNTKTKKKEDSASDYLFWHYVVIILNIVSVIVGLLTIEDRPSAYVFSFWAITNTALLIHFVVGASEFKFNFKKNTQDEYVTAISDRKLINLKEI